MKRILFWLFLIVPVVSQAQEKLSFQSASGIVEFQISSTEYFVKFRKEDRQAISKVSKDFSLISESSALIKIEESPSNFTIAQSLINIRYQGQILASEPVLVFRDGIREVYGVPHS